MLQRSPIVFLILLSLAWPCRANDRADASTKESLGVCSGTNPRYRGSKGLGRRGRPYPNRGLIHSRPCVRERTDDGAEALVREALHRVNEVRPAIADYKIVCAWNKQPGFKWTIDGRSNHSSMRIFRITEKSAPEEDILFPTGLFSRLRRHIDPFPDESTVSLKDTRKLPSEDVQGVHCDVIEFSGALPAGGVRIDGAPAPNSGKIPLRAWDRAAMRWYVDQEHRIRRISAWFQWNEWAGDTDVRLTMDALIVHGKPKTGAERPISPPPLAQIRTSANEGRASTFVCSPSGQWLAASGDTGVTVYDTRTCKPVAKIGDANTRCLCFMPHSSTLATATGMGGVIAFWDAASGKQKRSFNTGVDYVRSCVFLPGDRLLIGKREGAVLWDITTDRTVIAALPKPESAIAVSSMICKAFSRTARWARRTIRSASVGRVRILPFPPTADGSRSEATASTTADGSRSEAVAPITTAPKQRRLAR